MQSQRFFIGNLPSGTTENEVKKAFKDFGDVTSVELKEKENLVDPSSVKLLAFITLNLYDNDVDFCLRKLNSKQINGEYVRVSVAKESFLERLKREREENSKAKPKPSNNSYEAKESYTQPPNKSKKFFDTEETEEADDTNENLFDDGEPVLITKKKAANSMRNGKIVIEGTNNKPIHVIGKQKDVKHLSEKSFDSDKKRKESVNKKKNQYQLQKSLIQKSLSSVDSSKNKQIFFDNDDDDEKESPSNAKQLFQDDSDHEENSIANDFAMKAEYEGSHGAALMKLQSKMNLDPRFKIDSKFIDRNDDDDEEPITNGNSERDWQYGILEQVVGTKVSSNKPQTKGHGNNKLNMLRYDPSKENQDQYLVKRKPAEPMDEDDENFIPQPEEKKVSKEVFYMVSDNLTNTLKTRGDGFSLLSMFGRGTDDENGPSEERTSKEKILISKSDKTGALNPFSYDSSSESENEQEKESKPQKETDKGPKTKSKDKKDNSTTTKLFIESFFIPRNDPRLKEGKTFFRANKLAEKIENYDEVKNKLKNIINRKITKSKKQLKSTGKHKSFRTR